MTESTVKAAENIPITAKRAHRLAYGLQLGIGPDRTLSARIEPSAKLQMDEVIH